tara:strand:+ start:527 stop:670 length:144 start_codon:yes stop_codon:yes gene_type:complete
MFTLDRPPICLILGDHREQAYRRDALPLENADFPDRGSDPDREEDAA